jgi:predicted peptidase
MGNKTIKYVVYLPAQYTPDKAWPVVIFLHGSGEVGSDGTRQLHSEFARQVKAHAERWPFVIIFPQKQNKHTRWWAEDSMVVAALRHAEADYHIDPSRVYLTGHSLGGQGTWSIAANHPGLFAAIAPVSGRAHLSVAPKLVGIPAWAFHGAKDRTIPVSETEKMVARLRRLGGCCKLSVYPNVGHNAARNAYGEEDLAGWFLAHHR